jgi:hypothetical protein
VTCKKNINALRIFGHIAEVLWGCLFNKHNIGYQVPDLTLKMKGLVEGLVSTGHIAT